FKRLGGGRLELQDAVVVLCAGAIAAARAGNIYADGAGAGPDERFTSTLDRAAVRAQAVATAHGIDRLAL
ncbi:hypothetical protein ACCD09_12860, partial [Variovorax sp. Varisp62]